MKMMDIDLLLVKCELLITNIDLLLRTFTLGPGQQRTSARGVLCWLASMQRMSIKRILCLRTCVSGVEGALQRCTQDCWEDD